MAKSARSSSKKANNQRKVRNINGPVEAARAQRLSARLIELAKQPKPETSDVKMDAVKEDATNEETEKPEGETKMEVDSVKPSSGRIEKKKSVDKRRQKKSSIVFQKYSDRQSRKKKSSA